MRNNSLVRLIAALACATLALAGCASNNGPQLAPATFVAMQEGPG